MGPVTVHILEKRNDPKKRDLKYEGKYCLENMLTGSKTSNYLDYLMPSRRNLMEAKMKFIAKGKRMRMTHEISPCLFMIQK